MGCDLCGASVGRVGMGVLSGLGGLSDWTVIWGFWEDGRVICVALAKVGRGDGGVVWTRGLSGLLCARCQVSKG